MLNLTVDGLEQRLNQFGIIQADQAQAKVMKSKFELWIERFDRKAHDHLDKGKVLGDRGKVVISAHFFGLEKENAPLLKRRIRQLGQVIDFLIRIMAMLQ